MHKLINLSGTTTQSALPVKSVIYHPQYPESASGTHSLGHVNILGGYYYIFYPLYAGATVYYRYSHDLKNWTVPTNMPRIHYFNTKHINGSDYLFSNGVYRKSPSVREWTSFSSVGGNYSIHNGVNHLVDYKGRAVFRDMELLKYSAGYTNWKSYRYADSIWGMSDGPDGIYAIGSSSYRYVVKFTYNEQTETIVGSKIVLNISTAMGTSPALSSKIAHFNGIIIIHSSSSDTSLVSSDGGQSWSSVDLKGLKIYSIQPDQYRGQFFGVGRYNDRYVAITSRDGHKWRMDDRTAYNYNHILVSGESIVGFTHTREVVEYKF